MIESKNNGRSQKSFEELKDEAQVASTRQVMSYALQMKQNAVMVDYRRIERGYAYIYRVGHKHFYTEEREEHR